jgi:hypothetical protein
MSAEWKKGFTDREIADLKLAAPEFTSTIDGVVVPTISKEELALLALRYPTQFAALARGQPSAAAIAEAADVPVDEAALRIRYPSMASRPVPAPGGTAEERALAARFPSMR